MRPEDGKKAYDNIEIPEELSEVVNRAIASQKKEEIREKIRKKKQRDNTVRIFRYVASAAAAFIVCMTIGVNTSEAFAKEVSDIPVLVSLSKVLTIRSYHGTDGDFEIDMEVPEIQKETVLETDPAADMTEETEKAGTEKTFTGDVNAEIEKIVDSYMDEAKQEFADYKEAFFATGGTQEEWADRKMDIVVDYDVKYQQGNILSLELITAKGWVSAQEERHYYNLDLATGQRLTLEQLLGASYIEEVSASIRQQIEERIASDDSLAYFGYGSMAEDDALLGIEGFSTIAENQDFYINEAGEVVIVFAKYDIAPGYMGFQEFTVGRANLNPADTEEK